MLTITLRRLFLPGDIEGFVALALENFVKLILIVTLCQEVLGFSPNLIYGRILPGIALSVCVGNCFYAWLAYHEGKQQSRLDMTALPYGVNTITVLPYIFLIMLPVRTAAIAQGASPEAAGELAWQAGIVACLGSGVIKLALLWVVNFLQKYIPLAAHLSTLGGIALTFIAMGFFLRTFTYPIVSFVPLGIILLAYFGRVKFAIPAGLLAILLGTVLAWGTGLMHWDNVNLKQALQPIGIYTPGIWLGQLWQGKGFLWEYLGVIFPLGISEFICAFQNLETAEAVGDSYPRKSALMAQGLFTLLAAVSGSCFPTIIYSGHQAWKAMESGWSYSILTGVFTSILALSGTVSLVAYFVPIEAGMAIFIAIAICIVTQAFTASPLRHIPAVVVGLLVSIAAWGALVAKTALRVGDMGTAERPFTSAVIEQFQLKSLFMDGAFALEQGYILTTIVLASIMVYIIEREFQKAAIWAILASLFSWLGGMHSYRWTEADTVGVFHWGAGGEWAVGYCLFAILLFYVHRQSKTDIADKQT